MPILPEYAAALAQLKTGALYTYSSGNATVTPEDIVPLKRDVPEIGMYEFVNSTFAVRQLTFGWLPTEVNKPLKDERVRRAISMSWDRDSYIDAFGNVSRFEADGLPIETFWNTNLNAGSGAWWLDPRSDEFGPDSRWYQLDIAEAKALLDAAGYPDGFDVSSMYIGGPQLGTDFQRQVGVCDEFASEIGIRVSPNVIDYTAEYIPVLRDGFGKFEGWGYRAGGAPANDAVAYLTTLYHSKKGQQFLGFDAAGNGDGSGDSEIDAMLDKAQGETDSDLRRAIVFDIQRHLANKMYMVPHPPAEATRFYMAWPAIQNFQVYQGDRRQPPFHWWLDESKAPLA
jgi:ABC-type transport system substrate-binding protein